MDEELNQYTIVSDRGIEYGYARSRFVESGSQRWRDRQLNKLLYAYPYEILKVKFLKPGDSGDYISTTGEEIIERDIDFEDLLKIIMDIENQKAGFGKSLHMEAFTGVDYLGNLVKFSSYVIWSDNNKIYKYNFDENWIPFDNERLRRDREEKLKELGI
jgi:hypothetical protein